MAVSVACNSSALSSSRLLACTARRDREHDAISAGLTIQRAGFTITSTNTHPTRPMGFRDYVMYPGFLRLLLSCIAGMSWN